METYDYVIVGAGSAGCVLADRLSADGAVSVLLLEAGGADDAPAMKIPGAFSSLFKTGVDWDYTTVPQPQLGGRTIYVPRGRVIGGSSSINVMIYVRGNRQDYDDWDANGAAAWSYDDVLPYFVRSEDNARWGAPYHGTGGPLRVEDEVYTHELPRLWVETAVDAGLPANDDFNGATQTGAGLYQLTCRDGRRWSAADAFLRPASQRPNLTIRTGALVRRVDFAGTTAVGVTYEGDGGTRPVRAAREVLLCGGAITSPQLLLQSGVGRADDLTGLGIDVAADLPGVGRNLHDHPMSPLSWTTRDTTDIVQLIRSDAALQQWQRERRGPMASNIGEAGTFFSTTDSALPDIQVYCGATAFYDALSHSPMPTFGVTPCLVDPRSRGQLRLNPGDPTGRPLIDLGLFKDEEDLNRLCAASERLTDMVEGSKSLRPFIDRPFLPSRAPLTRREWADHIRQNAQTMFHPVGTCRMGTDDGAVVDPELRVRGIEGLRVIDASVMPVVPRGNTNAPTIMIAERAADLVQS